MRRPVAGMTRVFVTGATGLIGSHVAERLRARGDTVVALVRQASDTAHLESLGCELVSGNVLDPVNDLAAHMWGCDAVVHSAAEVFRSGGRKVYHRVNVQGTERVLQAAALVAPRVVHVSSVAVYAGLPMDRPLTEERWKEADISRQSAYAWSKQLSEQAAWRLHETGEIRLTTVRPSVVYGERDRAATPIFVRLARRRVAPLIDGGRHTVPVVYAGNVARGIVAALDRRAAVGRVYNLGRDLPVTGRELTRLFGEGLGRTPRVVAVPHVAISPISRTVQTLSVVLPLVPTSNIHRAVRSLSVENPYDSGRARLELGWGGLTPHAEGVRRTLDWWRA
jgi:nucleoside-diphosphate-sugar epimerase